MIQYPQTFASNPVAQLRTQKLPSDLGALMQRVASCRVFSLPARQHQVLRFAGLEGWRVSSERG